MSHETRTITLSGFDPEGEPEIRVMSDGSLNLVFNFMPPSDSEDPDDLGQFEDFDKQLEAAIGVPVLLDDREVFVVSSPKADTVEKLDHFIKTYRATHL